VPTKGFRQAGMTFAGASHMTHPDRGEVVRLLTGAPIPPDVDAVVMEEKVRLAGTDVHFVQPAESGLNIRRRGEDVDAGSTIVEAGTMIDARHVAILAASGGIHPRFFRAPGGRWSIPMEAEVRAQHMTALKWTVDPRDWSRPGSRQITAAVMSQLRPGGVVLMHDGGGDRSQTVDALRRLIKVLRGAGYYFATL